MPRPAADILLSVLVLLLQTTLARFLVIQGIVPDLVLLDARKPHLYPLNMPVDKVTCFANGGDVDTVIVDGKPGSAVHVIGAGEIDWLPSVGWDAGRDDPQAAVNTASR